MASRKPSSKEWQEYRQWLGLVEVEGWDAEFCSITLATRSYVHLIEEAKALGYKVTLLFIWLDSPKTAIQRVAGRVAKGGQRMW